MAISSSRQNSSIGNLCHIVSSIHHDSTESSPIRQTSIPNSRPSNASDDDENLIVHDAINGKTPPRQHVRQISNDESVRSDSTSRRSPVSPIKTNHQARSSLSPLYRREEQQQNDKVSHRTSPIVASSQRSPITPPRINNQEKSNLSPPYRQQQDERVSYRTSSIASSSQRSPVSPIRTNNHEQSNLSPPRQQQQQQQQPERVSYRTSSIGSSSRRSSEHFPPPPPPQNFETLDTATNGSVPRRSGSSVSYRSSIHEEVHTPDVSPLILLFLQISRIF